MTTRIVFNNDIIKFMSIFQNVTKTSLKDCIDSNSKMIFIVDENQAGKAIGKKGANIKRLEQKFKKKVMVVEYSKDISQFIKNVIYPSKVKDITEEDGTFTITPIDTYTRGVIIGRSAANLREFESIVKRYYPIKELKVAQ
ncbi:NusA-like transcription termination signal-binding factor [Candidatus Woesearchaeota archaeon]|nr:NusA-like transcription termination signal-binding factor [Candidatus Woesearchaeota archaeon]